MPWSNHFNRVVGVSLLVLALLIVLSIAFSIPLEDSDPFERDEVEDFLIDVNDNEALAVLGTAADIIADAAIAIVAAAGLYLLFRERDRLLALIGFGLLLAGSAAFMASDAASVPLIVLAEDFAEKGGPGGIAAGDAVILETARGLAVWAFTVEQIAFTAISVGLLAFGSLIAWATAGAGANPPRWIGWLAVIAGLAGVLTYIGVASEGVGIALFIVAGIATLLFLIALGIWLLMQPEDSGPTTAPAA